MKRAVFFIMISATYALSTAAIINIPDDYPTIQQGIEASTDGDTVLVADGVYYERINFHGKAIHVASALIIDGDRSHMESTIIDADTLVIGVADTGSAVCFVSGEDSTSVLQGFTIRSGIGTSISIYHRIGGGIYCVDNSAPSIRDNIILDNSASAGAGICCMMGSDAKIVINRIRNNRGHGIYLSDSSPLILWNTIDLNSAEYGSGIYCNTGSDALIKGNKIHENFGALWGGGIYCNNCEPVIANNLLYGNSVVDWGGGICCDNSDATIINNTIADNSAQGDGGGVYCLNGATPILINTIIWDNTTPNIGIRSTESPLVSYCNVTGGWEGDGNIDIDPLFRNPGGGNYHLMFNECDDLMDSPCIDVGDPDILDGYLECSWGLGTLASDMGAYGGDYSPTTAIDDPSYPLPVRTAIVQNYPNPFNARTAISYSLSRPGEVTISVYNLLGQQVDILHEGQLESGEHILVWDAAPYPSGIYFARLKTEERSGNIKMTLLK